ncbi:NUDIX hydrolase [Catenulispora sp. NL8]|uniref:NUDIX hydrolase n=1 Tax=Catenulispora pinistramenti TaxID=2705254 RepID=A0ABS5L520_9ACTN|nr:NUDIX hydrolase [Catenulispora pinistramenti]MBS2553417.1 NUDIX hydrolase [Catenulispora pinistramenti]
MPTPADMTPAEWDAYLAEGNAKQARKRVAADVLLRDEDGRILLVDPNYKPDWDLPGGMAEANEPPDEAARRELVEELGLRVNVGGVLCIDWVSPHGPWDDQLAFIFDAGRLTRGEIAAMRILDGELDAFAFVDEDEAARRLRPYVWARLRAALDALEDRQTRYLRDGQRVAA